MPLFAVYRKALLGHRTLFPRHLPKAREVEMSFLRDMLDFRKLREIQKDIARHRRADDFAIEHERCAEDPQAMDLRRRHGGPLTGLRQTLDRAFYKEAGVISSVIEELKQRSGVDPEYDTQIGAEQLDGDMSRGCVLLQRGLPEIGAKEYVIWGVHRTALLLY